MLEVTSLCGQINLGKQGENLARVVNFEGFSEWMNLFGEGVFELIHQRNGDVAPYPVVLNVEDDRICWKITASDTAIVGDGKCELRYIVDDVVVKSKTFTTTVFSSLGDGVTEAPEPYQGWVNEVLKAAEKITVEAVELNGETKELNEKTKGVLDAEAERIEAETKRIEAENIRVRTENGRIDNENKRQENEAIRHENYAKLSAETETLKEGLKNLKEQTEQDASNLSGIIKQGTQELVDFKEKSAMELESVKKATDDATNKADIAISDAEKAALNATDAADNANHGAYEANNAAENANAAAGNANEAAENANAAAGNANEAAENANAAAGNANEAAENANAAAGNANEAAENANNAVGTMNGTFANALKGTASGEIVAIDDISPIEHNLRVKVSSKNLVDVANWAYRYCKYDNGIITCNMNNQQYAEIYSTRLNDLLLVNKGKTITFSIAEVLENRFVSIVIQGMRADGTPLTIAPYAKNTNAISVVISEEFASISMITLRFNWQSGVAFADTTTTITNVQLEFGNKTEYAPYVGDISTATLRRFGKNLFSNDLNRIKKVTYIRNGVETSRYGYEIDLPVGTYTIRADSSSVTNNNYIYGCIVNANNVYEDGKGIQTVVGTELKTVTFTINSGEKLKIYCGSDMSAMIEEQALSTVKKIFEKYTFQLEVGESASEYASYTEPLEYTPNADGTVDDVKSFYPTTTLMADTSGIIIDCAYNKDTNKVIETLIKAIISLGGNV